MSSQFNTNIESSAQFIWCQCNCPRLLTDVCVYVHIKKKRYKKLLSAVWSAPATADKMLSTSLIIIACEYMTCPAVYVSNLKNKTRSSMFFTEWFIYLFNDLFQPWWLLGVRNMKVNYDDFHWFSFFLISLLYLFWFVPFKLFFLLLFKFTFVMQRQDFNVYCRQ